MERLEKIRVIKEKMTDNKIMRIKIQEPRQNLQEGHAQADQDHQAHSSSETETQLNTETRRQDAVGG